MSGQIAAAAAAVRVLIVDDEAIARRALRAFLETCPQLAVVGEAGDGAEAVRIAADRRPDVVLMDYSMPVMDGVEATRRIKAARPETAVVLVSVYVSAEPEAREASVDAFLLKGFTGDELIETIESTVAAARPG
jgi:DNA-binding NarL/FixJ family response regulator